MSLLRNLFVGAVLTLSNAAFAHPVSDNWGCQARVDLSSKIRLLTFDDTDKAAKCASKYLSWAVDEYGNDAELIEALKARHAAFYRYTSSLAGGTPAEVRSARDWLAKADASVQAEAATLQEKAR